MHRLCSYFDPIYSQSKARKALTVCLSLRSGRVGLACGRLPLLSSLAPRRRPLRMGICKNHSPAEDAKIGTIEEVKCTQGKIIKYSRAKYITFKYSKII